MTLLRFMGDMAEAKYDDDDEAGPKVPIMQSLNTSLSRSYTKSRIINNENVNKTQQYKLIQRTLKRKSKLPDEMRMLAETSEETAFYQRWLGARSNNLEKIHFIIGHGILRPAIRYNMICCFL